MRQFIKSIASRRFSALLFAFAASIGALFAQSGTCGKQLKWALDNGVLTISGTGAMDDFDYNYEHGQSTAPWFDDRASITSIEIKDGVTTIGKRAFMYCEAVASVSIPNSVTSIGEVAFSDCSSLVSIAIPNSVTALGAWAFYNCSSLNTIIIPNGVVSIGHDAFYGCSSLLAITIPYSITRIEDSSFYGCSSLKSVFIPNSVVGIGSGAFYGCNSLISISIPNSVAVVGDNAFYGCSGLTSPVFNDHVFAYMPKDYSGAYTISSGIQSIAGGAFNDCAGLTSVTIPNSVTSIGSEAFMRCTGLTSISIPNSVTNLGYRAFNHCTGLTSITIPNSISFIGNGAFFGCSSLQTVEIPNSVTRIGGEVFDGCEALSMITCYSITPPTLTAGKLFGQNPPEVTLNVPTGFSDVFRNSKFGQQFNRVEEIYVKPAILLSRELDVANAQVSKLVQQRNETVSRSVYTQYLNTDERNRFMPPYAPATIPDSYDFNQAKALCDSLLREAETLRQQDHIAMVKDYLRTTRPDDFVAAYFKENPAEKAHLGGEHKEYRCHYAAFNDFVIQYEQGLLQASERNCRDTKWAECAEYYASRELFDADYDQGDETIAAYRERIDQAWAQLQQVPEKVLKKNLQGVAEEAKEDVANLISIYRQLAPSPTFQDRAADFLFTNNKKMLKEYEKSGALFASKIDFVAAYISADYKQILKSKK